jgi:probable rRNA maturation factor
MNGKRKSAARAVTVEVNIMRKAGAWSKSIPDYPQKVESWCRAALAQKLEGALSVVLADDNFVRELNYTYRGKNKPTNVLSFPGAGDELGDVVLAYETIQREAKEQKKKMVQHTAHLVIHGCLHLLGYDHENNREAKQMEKLEAAILAKFGFPDPYRAVV